MGYCVLKIDEALPLPQLVGQDVAESGERNEDKLKETRKERTTMPAGDGTGPRGMGPMTGRAAGYCAGYSTAGYMSPMPGQGYGGRGRGGGRGRRNWFYATGLPGWQRAGMGQPAWGAPQPFLGPAGFPPAPGVSGEQEFEALRSQAEGLETALQNIRKRIDELAAEAAEKA